MQVQLTDLQEMQNHMRETIDQGLQDLQAKQGTGGLPAAPPSAQAPPVEAQYASVAPPPEPNLATDIQQADQQGDQAEKEVTAEAAQDSGAPGGAASCCSGGSCIGRTGPDPRPGAGGSWRAGTGGESGIQGHLLLHGMKVIFKDGKVSDVQ